MRRLARHRPSPAMIVALIALFVALSGASYAALAVNSVGPKQLKKDAVRSSKVKDGSLTGGDVKDSSLTGGDLTDGSVALADLGNNSVNGTKIVDGSIALPDLGPNSVDGSKVANGSLEGGDVKAGTFLGGSVTTQYTEGPELADGTKVSINAFCLPGEIALGGGARGDLTTSEATTVTSSRPITSETNEEAPIDGGTFTGWRATVFNIAGGVTTGIFPEVWVICAKLP
jgi:hypothetical protein